MAGPGNSMLYSFFLFIAILSVQEIYRGKLASSELFTILGGFSSSLIFLVLLTISLEEEEGGTSVFYFSQSLPLDASYALFIGNYQETYGVRTGWGAVILAEAVALIAASTVHRVCITTCFLFSAALLYEVNKLSGTILSKDVSKSKRF